MIKNIIFDFGNVLVDYNSHRIYDSYFGDVDKAGWFRENIILKKLIRQLDIGEDFEECLRIAQKENPEYAEAIAMYGSHYYKMDGGVIPGMFNLLTTLSDKGFRLYGLTNWSYKVYEVIKRHTIFSLLEGYVISSEIHLLKPDPKIYIHLTEKFSLRPNECLFIDDKLENVEGAENIGMHGIQFFNAEQLTTTLYQLSLT